MKFENPARNLCPQYRSLLPSQLIMDPVTLHVAVSQVLGEIAIIPREVHAYRQQCISLAQRCISHMSDVQEQLHRRVQRIAMAKPNVQIAHYDDFASLLNTLLLHLLKVQNFMSKFKHRSYFLKFWKRNWDQGRFRRYRTDILLDVYALELFLRLLDVRARSGGCSCRVN